MARVYYDAMLILSLVLGGLYMLIWHKHFDVHITLIFALVPATNLGYALLCRAQTLEAALVANKITYLGGCFPLLMIMFATFNLCHIKLNRWVRFCCLLLSAGVFAAALTMGVSPDFYTQVTLDQAYGATVLRKEYGPLHALFYGMVGLYFALSIGAMAYSYVRKKQVSRKIIYLLFLPVAASMLCFFGGRRLFPQIELVPAAYTAALIVYLVIGYQISLYDITDTAMDSLAQTGTTGFVSFDFKNRYLGSNQTAKNIFPALTELTVDRPITKNPFMRENALPWLQAFKTDEDQNSFFYEKGEKTYLVTVNYLYSGKRRRGYQFFITDDTADRQYIKLLDSFNTELQTEVAAKTAHILAMHDQLVMGMATMVESRDNSTGGHIRRTSEGVRLLIEEIRRDGRLDLSDTFCKNIIKAAPMHDLGKIAVDDAILRKPGRFTPEEFEQMKGHAAEGARIVGEILKDTDDEEFRRVAVNVAHYHHERWDGSGYPEGLRKEQIPLEARIMAVADVYDALVSKRVYKDKMPFEKAHGIIMDGMGTQFDPAMAPYYLAARQKLEAYYSAIS